MRAAQVGMGLLLMGSVSAVTAPPTEIVQITASGVAEPDGDMTYNSEHGAPSISDDGRVAFVSNADLVTGQNPDGHDQVFLWTRGAKPPLAQLTRDDRRKSSAVISRDGTVIAFVTGGPARALLDAKQPSEYHPAVHLVSTRPPYRSFRLTDPARERIANYAQPTVSDLRQGRYRVVFSRIALGGRRLVGVEVEGAEVRKLTLPDEPAGDPSIDAEGRWLAFTAGSRFEPSTIHVGEIGGAFRSISQWTSTNDERSTTNAGKQPFVVGRSSFVARASESRDEMSEFEVFRHPRISGDGSAVVFEAAPDLDPVLRGDNSGTELFLYRIRERTLIRLTRTPGGPDSRLYNRQPSINHDGRVVAFVSNTDHGKTNPDRNAEIFTWTAGAGTPLAAVTLSHEDRLPVTCSHPAVALVSDGSGARTRVAFVSNGNLASAYPNNEDMAPEIYVATLP